VGVLSASISLHCPFLGEWITPGQNSALKGYGMELTSSQTVKIDQPRQLGRPAQMPVVEVEKA